jgi:hypothetical protein
MGILNIVFGSLFLLCNLCAGIILMVFLSSDTFPGSVNPIADMWTFMKREVPAFAVVNVGQMAVGFCLSVVLIVAGIGLLYVKRWGRVLSIFYSLAAIVIQIGGLIFTLAIVNPATERWQQDFLRRHGGPMMRRDAFGNSALNNVSAAGGAVVGMIYAIVLLIMMLLPSVSVALAAGRGPDNYDRGRYDDEEDDLGRERRRQEDWHE